MAEGDLKNHPALNCHATEEAACVCQVHPQATEKTIP